MADRPILFSAPMVRAILTCTKSQTRRVVKPRPDKDMGPRCVLQPHELAGEANGGNYRNAYCAPGDRLWVREAYRLCAEADGTKPRDTDASYRIWYEADAPHQPGAGKLRPGMFMPRWASRIALEVTGVRVERLQDITQADARAEGAPPSHPSIDAVSRGFGFADFPRSWYAQLWDQINGPGAWSENAWVWVVSFKVAP